MTSRSLEPENSKENSSCQGKFLPAGSPSRCAAGGQTSGSDKRAVDSHVQTTGGSAARSARGAKANRGSPVNDRVENMKNLGDYLPKKRGKKKLVEISESPIFSPDATLDALRNAEILLKKARERILEASYDIASSPEREQSGRSEGAEEEEDARYIRDVVATRFHEANESARIFTRPSTRPLAERICRPIIRERRAKRTRARLPKISTEKSATTSRLKSAQVTSTNFEKNRRISASEFRREGASIRQHVISDFPSPWTIDNRNVTNLLRVQRGPRVDIPNELTITNVEKVDISPEPRSSFPVQQNIKTYEFQHESCVGKKADIGGEIGSEEVASIIPTRDSPGEPEKSRDSIWKSRGFAAASHYQGSDLGQNKLARSIPPKQLEGRADYDNAGIANRTECIPEANQQNHDKRNPENLDECFMDFLRRSTNFPAADKNNILKDFPSPDINNEIIDRAIDQLVSELRHEKRRQTETNDPTSSKKMQNNCLPVEEVNESGLLEDAARKAENFMLREFQESEYFPEEWLPEEIHLEAPNLAHLEKTFNNFDSIMYKVLRGTKELEAIMSTEYSTEAEIPPGSINQHCSYKPRLCSSVANKDRVGEPQLKSTNRLEREKALDYLTGSCENASELSASRYNNELRRKLAKELTMERESSKKLLHHPRFSTPLNNDLKITRPCRFNADCQSNEFARFLIGIQSSKSSFDYQEGASSGNSLFPRLEMESADDKTALNKNEFHPVFSGPVKNNIQLEINIVPNETNEKNKDLLSSRATNEDKTHWTLNSPCDFCYPIEKNERSETKSLIGDSAIGRVTDRSGKKCRVATKLVDEHSVKKDFTKSEQRAPSETKSTRSEQSAIKRDEETQLTGSIAGKNVESTGTKTLTMKNKVVHPAESIRKTEINSEKNKKTTNDKNSLAGSTSGSSLKDRTSFDISNVYSEDFEEPVMTEKSVTQEKIEIHGNDEVKSTWNCVEIAKTKESMNDNGATMFTSSSLHSEETDKSHNGSKQEKQYLDRSVSIASSKTSDKIQERSSKGDIAENRSIEMSTEEKGVVECNSEIKETGKIIPQVQEKFGLDECAAASDSASTKASETSSITGESRPEEIKNPTDSTDHEIPSFELDKNNIPSSCLNCREIFDKCDCKARTSHCSMGKSNKVVDKSSSIGTIKTVMNDSLETIEDEKLCIFERVTRPLKFHSDHENSAESNQRSCDKNVVAEKLQDLLMLSGRYKIQEQNTELTEAECQVENQSKNSSQELEEWQRRESLKILGIDFNDNIGKPNKNVVSESRTKLQEFTNFESSVPFHSTPKHFIPSDSSELCCIELSKIVNTNNANVNYFENTPESKKEDMNISRIDYTDRVVDEGCQNAATDLEEINNNFPCPIIIDLTSNRLKENSRCVSSEPFSLDPEPIPDEDHANVAADTCSENYSEGELYLPSSCSYSLGEIRISERGSCGTAPSVIHSVSAPSFPAMRIYFRNKNSTRHTSHNTIKASNSPMQSPGEVQETDVESICSSQGQSSEGEHHMGQRYILQLKSID